MAFSELIKNFDKTRDYMKDFYIYGFKTRNDFQYKSLRTYDNERRRIESYLNKFVSFINSKKGKQVFISCDASRINENPLYNAYRCKSFTKNDIHLHFFILDILKEDFLSLNEIIDKILDVFGIDFEPQTVRIKLNEYVKEGIIVSQKSGKTILYAKAPDNFEKMTENFKAEFVNMIKFFSETAPFGVVGNYILKRLNKINDLFLLKHNFIVHTLEDNILLSLICAINEKRLVKILNYGKSQRETEIIGIPIKIHISTQTGRRYIIIYVVSFKRFLSLRLDHIKSVKLSDTFPEYDIYREKYLKNVNYCWGTSFGVRHHEINTEYLKMTIYIDEQNEKFILERLNREGRGGKITKQDTNIFQYYGEFFDVSEMSPWIKTFIGRIINLETNNFEVKNKFYNDIALMNNIYNRNED